jgi:hypothetical protein
MSGHDNSTHENGGSLWGFGPYMRWLQVHVHVHVHLLLLLLSTSSCHGLTPLDFSRGRRHLGPASSHHAARALAEPDMEHGRTTYPNWSSLTNATEC